MLLDGLAALKFLFDFKPKHFFAVLKAHFHFYLNLSKLLKKRRELIPTKKDYFLVNSIVWQYFVKRNKTFKDII